MTEEDERLLDRRAHALGSRAPLFYDEPLHIVRGEGVWLTAADGRRYLDVYNNVPHVGHCHPHVVQAVARQAGMLNIHTRYLHENVVRYAERLAATVDFSPAAVMFTCTGTESNELALRLARFRTGGEGVIVSSFSYHGNSQLLAALTTGFPVPEKFPAFARSVPIPDPYLDGAGLGSDELGERFVAKIDDAIVSLKAEGIALSALLFDASFANEGLPALTPSYLRRAVELVRAAGGMFIADEVQGGFGRTGEAMWAHQLHGVVPDLITLGKPMGNGHPVAGVIAPLELVEAFGRTSLYFNTFGGNPVSAAAGMAVLDVIEQEGLREKAAAIGRHVHARLLELQERHEAIGDIRTRGMFFALNLVEDRDSKAPATAAARKVVNGLKDAGILISRIGPFDNILKMRPPMVFQREHADRLIQTLDDVLEAQL